MNYNMVTNCPPFRQEDIIAVRGKPATKKVEQVDDNLQPVEEWAYFSTNTGLKECFFFINNRLVGWSEVKM